MSSPPRVRLARSVQGYACELTVGVVCDPREVLSTYRATLRASDHASVVVYHPDTDIDVDVL